MRRSAGPQDGGRRLGWRHPNGACRVRREVLGPGPVRAVSVRDGIGGACQAGAGLIVLGRSLVDADGWEVAGALGTGAGWRGVLPLLGR